MPYLKFSTRSGTFREKMKLPYLGFNAKNICLKLYASYGFRELIILSACGFRASEDTCVAQHFNKKFLNLEKDLPRRVFFIMNFNSMSKFIHNHLLRIFNDKFRFSQKDV